MTYNGTVINKVSDNVNMLVNMAILERYDEEEEKFDLKKEQEAMKNPKYFKKLKLPQSVRREIDSKNLIKINTTIKYIPVVYTDQNTKFRINFGATAFRNQQPEFAAGLLQDFREDQHSYLVEPRYELIDPAQEQALIITDKDKI